MDDETIDSGSYDSSSDADDTAAAAPEPVAEAPAAPEPAAEVPAPEPELAAEEDAEVETIAIETDDDEGPELVAPKAGCFGALLALAGLGAAVGYGVSLYT